MDNLKIIHTDIVAVENRIAELDDMGHVPTNTLKLMLAELRAKVTDMIMSEDRRLDTDGEGA